MLFSAKRLLASALFILLICGCGDKEASRQDHPSGSAPGFALKDLNGRIKRLEDLRGKVVLLNFFATWCPPCRQEIPGFVHLYEEYRDKGFEIVGVSLDVEGATVLRPFVRQYSIAYPILVGTQKVAADYGGIRALPTTFLIDRNGMISKQFVGLRPAHVFEASVRELLAHQMD